MGFVGGEGYTHAQTYVSEAIHRGGLAVAELPPAFFIAGDEPSERRAERGCLPPFDLRTSPTANRRQGIPSLRREPSQTEGRHEREVAARWPLQRRPPGLRHRGVPRIAAFEDLLFRGRRSFGDTSLTLVTFTPAFPTRPWSCRPSFRSSFLSWGCPRSPLRRIDHRGVHSWRARRRTVAAPPSEKSSQLFPRSDLVVSHHPAGFLLPGDARVLQRASDPGVHHVSAP